MKQFVAAVVFIVSAAAPSFAWNVKTAVAGQDDLQAVLDAAQCGDSIRLSGTFVGHFKARVSGCDNGNGRIILRSVSDAPAPPAIGGPGYVGQMAVIKSPDNLPALVVTGSHWVVKFIEMPGNAGQGDILDFGVDDTTQNSNDKVPVDLELAWCYLHGDPNGSTKRGLSLNANVALVHYNYVSDIHAVGQDSQAIGAYNGIGNYTIEYNHLEAAGEVVMFGGDSTKISGLVQTAITFRYNYVGRPMAWKGGPWQIKNLFEIKSATAVHVYANIFENHWQQAQKGPAILFTPRNQYGTDPWTEVGNVVFSMNWVRNVASGISILGYDNLAPSQQTHDITINSNIIETNKAALGGDGRPINLDVGQIDGARSVHVIDNTFHADGSSVVYASGTGIFHDFEYLGNLALHQNYGIMSSAGIGNPTINTYFPDGTFDIVNTDGSRPYGVNALAGGSASRYPALGFSLPSVVTFKAQFVNWDGGDYHLIPGATVAGGADVDLVLSETATVH